MTRIVTDTAADLPRSFAESADITVARGSVRLGGQQWHGEAEDFWSALAQASDLPATDAPSTATLAAAYSGEEPVLAVHVSAELSRTLANAREAAQSAPVKVDVIDSRSLSVGTGIIALAASEAVQAGVCGDRLLAMAEKWVDQLHTHAVIDDVSFLLNGGRAGLVAAKIHRRSQRHVIAVKGHAIPISEVHHRNEAVRELIDHVRDHVGTGISRWAVAHGDAADVDRFVERLESVFCCNPTFVTLLGAPVGSHLGPRSLLVSFLSDA